VHVRIKICGITQYEDAKTAAALGVDALGFIFCVKSPRCVTPAQAAEIIRRLPPFVNKVGVFVDETTARILEIARQAGIDTVQLHGSESPAQCREIPYPVIKALSVAEGFDIGIIGEYPAAGILLDTWDEQRRGGTGRCFDWSIAENAARRFPHVILAGGLGPANLAEALDKVAPFGVDLNSGVEIKPGVKNPLKIRDAVAAVRAWER
jgi:phosphoribosylanthranilate isomerase